MRIASGKDGGFFGGGLQLAPDGGSGAGIGVEFDVHVGSSLIFGQLQQMSQGVASVVNTGPKAQRVIITDGTIRHESQIATSGNFGEDNFGEMMIERTAAIISYVKSHLDNEIMIWSDIDIVFFRDCKAKTSLPV